MGKVKTHWKKTVDKDWIGTYILPDSKPIIVNLISVKYEEVKVKGVKGLYKVAYFAKNDYFDRPMLLSANKNLERLTKLTGTPYIEDWVTLDIWVTLQQEMDKAFGGGKDWALRIAAQAPQVKTVLDYPNDDKALRACNSLQELQATYLALPKELQSLFTGVKNALKTNLS
jgi:hypothetical protein